MDVGDPSNFIRIRHLFNDDFEKLRENLSSYAFSDSETRAAMKFIYDCSKYIADPHGAVGYLGLKKFQENRPDIYGIFLETAHPVKFLKVVEQTLGQKLDIPTQIKKVMEKEKKSIQIEEYEALKKYLLKRN